MARSATPVVAFLGGEVDSYADARIDLDIHPQTAKTLENVSLIKQGGMELSPGSRYVGETPASAQVWLRPWVFDTTLSYTLEWSDGLLRFIYDTGYVSLAGADAALADFTDESAVPSSGGDPPPDGGSGAAMMASVLPTSVTGTLQTPPVTCTVVGGSGSYSALWTNTSLTSVFASTPDALTTRFEAGTPPDTAFMVCTVTDLETGEVVNSNICSVRLKTTGIVP